MRFKKEFEMPINKSSTVVATIELSEENCLEQIVVHPISGFNKNDYATILVTWGDQEIYKGELKSDGMVIDLPQCLLGTDKELVVSLECLSLWSALTGDTSGLDYAENYWAKFSLVFIDNVVTTHETEEFDSDFVNQYL
jgi:hypothetical protein